MDKYRLEYVGAFSSTPYEGAATAVVLEGDALGSDQMQMIARHLNLSETVFLLAATEKSGADYLARIFTPKSELPFAGHPTVAACHSYLESKGGRPSTDGIVYQECGIGVIPIRVEGRGTDRLLVMTQGRPSYSDAHLEPAVLCSLLGLKSSDVDGTPAEVCSTGLPWLVVRVNSLAALKDAKPNQGLIRDVSDTLGVTGLTAYSTEAELDGCSVHVRTFAPKFGVEEDPTCGSCNGALATHVGRYVYPDQKCFHYTAEQGLEIERKGRIFVSVTGNGSDALTVRVGGGAVTFMTGEILA